MSNTIAMIFAAGLGTRLKPWTDSHPKALAPVNGKSLLQRNVELLQRHGIMDVVVNVHHFAGQIKNELNANKGWGSMIRISDESDEVLETGGGLLKAMPLLSGFDRILTLNADILTDINIEKLLQYHDSANCQATVAVMKRSSSRYLLFSEQMKLCGWRNVSTTEEVIRMPDERLLEYAFSGITIFENSISGKIRMSGKFSLLDVLLDICKDDSVIGFDHTGDLFMDVGKPGSLEEAEKHFK